VSLILDYKKDDFIISNFKFNNSIKVGKFYLDGDIINYNNLCYLYKGYFFELKDISQLNSTLNNNPSKFKGEFVLAQIYKNKVKVITDKLSLCKFYYYYDHKKFILSTNFWKILQIIKPSYKNLDPLGIKENIFLYKTLNGRTLIKNLKYSFLSQILVYNSDKNDLKINNYFDYFNKNKIKDNDDFFFDRLNSCFKKQFKEINKLSGNKKVGVAISGGLDSRLIPHFLNEKKDVVFFQIGKYKHGFLDEYDVLIANKILDYYNLSNLKTFDIRDDPLFKKSLLDIYSNPINYSNILKAHFVDDFDVIITGGYGTIVGSSIISFFGDLTYSEIVDAILNYSSKINSPFLRNRVYTLLSLIFPKLKENKKNYPQIKGLLSKKEIKSIVSDINFWIKKYSNKFKPFEIIWLFWMMAAPRAGAFESQNLRKENFSIYYPYVFEEVMNWPHEKIYDRNLFEKYLSTRFTTLSKIKGQLIHFNNIFDFFKKVPNLINYSFRGSSLDYRDWHNDKRWKKFVLSVLKKKNPFFDKLVKLDQKKIFKLNDILLENIIKNKLMLDIIYHKDYGVFNYLDKYNKENKNNKTTGNAIT